MCRQMTPLDWITSDRAIVSLWVVLSIASIYHGFTTQIPEPIFGVDESVWLGISFIVTGIIFWYGFRLKRKSSSRY